MSEKTVRRLNLSVVWVSCLRAIAVRTAPGEPRAGDTLDVRSPSEFRDEFILEPEAPAVAMPRLPQDPSPVWSPGPVSWPAVLPQTPGRLVALGRVLGLPRLHPPASLLVCAG